MPDTPPRPNPIVIVGPTGTGKSDLSLNLAERLRDAGTAVEIVNADAMQLYRGMDIGTAKVPERGRRGIRHHLLDVLDVVEEASVATYQREARAAIDDIRDRGAVPVLVGGSGLYVSAAIFDLRFPGTDPALRQRLLGDDLDRLGPGGLHERLAVVDPAAAQAIDPRNVRRVVRALEVVELTGRPFSAALPERPEAWMPATVIGLRTDRDDLVARLDRRVLAMWADGLVEEAAGLIPAGIERGKTASKAIGYAQALAQLNGTLDEPAAIAQTQQLTRRYARRQLGWFRRYPSITWLDATASGLVDDALRYLDLAR